MKFVQTALQEVIEVTPEPHPDSRGWFARVWCHDEFRDAGLELRWVQANEAFSERKGTLRGVHLQHVPDEEVKYVRCHAGAIFDVAVDLRPESSTFGHWVGRELTAQNGVGLVVPRGFGHAYVTLMDQSVVAYWTTSAYAPESATGVRYDDPTLSISWPIEPSIISDQDRSWPWITTPIDS